MSCHTGEQQEFIIKNIIGTRNQIFIYVKEEKRSKLRQATKHCMLALKDMRDNKSRNILYILNNFQALSLWVNKESERLYRSDSS